MRNVLVILALLFCVANTIDMGEELMKREILTKIVEYAGIEMPHELHLLCLPCKLMMKQVQKFSSTILLSIIRKEWTFLCPKFKDPAFCEGINQTFIDQFSVHFLNNYLAPSNACQNLGVCKLQHERQTIKEYINEVMQDKLSKEEQRQWQVIAEENIQNQEDFTVAQFADLHIDVEYSVGANAFCGAPFCCREENGKPKDPSKGAQYWGTYADCDLPFRTIQDLIKFTGEKIKPDFIIWTGDSTSHDVWHQQKWNQTLPTKMITDEIKKQIPNSQLYAIYGNHEGYPADQYDMIGESTQWLRDEVADMWKQYLTQESYYQLRRNGYYSQVEKSRNLKFIALNSQACDLLNFHLMDGITDPRGMLKWLISELKDSEDKHQFAVIYAHIPPGDTFCNSQWADRFSVVIERFEHVVTGIFYGHTHQDHVQHIRSKIDGRYVKTLFIAPSGTTFSYQNPSFRVFQFNGKNNSVKDYVQYRLDLAKANKDGQNAILNWEVAYNFLEYYGLESASLVHVSSLPYRLAHDDELLKKYIYSYSTGSDILYKKHLKNLKNLFLKKGTKSFFICGAQTSTLDDWYDCVGFFEKFKESSFLTFKLLEQFIGKWLKE
ncbi:unnamed protein product [Paramecium primaurelia]|uniref:Sphingomyelin phosphodiesterase n=1 Tax=Paramecium primaurelia TaxID=5886 RepID=A0A8S1K2A3_PARPR|nr:unnamed protein product [Paramecium primaurelia]